MIWSKRKYISRLLRKEEEAPRSAVRWMFDECLYTSNGVLNEADVNSDLDGNSEQEIDADSAGQSMGEEKMPKAELDIMHMEETDMKKTTPTYTKHKQRFSGKVLFYNSRQDFIFCFEQ